MGDSDDEYDRKRRDKFRGERSADTYRSERRDDRSRGRDDWPDRGRGRPDYRDYRPVRDRYSPGREAPPIKRMRGDWGDDRPRYGGHEPYGPYVGHPYEPYPIHGGHGFGGHPPGAALHGARNEPSVNPDIQTQPQMMTLKQFLATQDDSISDSDAIAKYNDYKLEFKRQQLNEFFVAHKDEEWFKIKYHPEDSSKRRAEQLNYLKNRVEVFAELLEKELITNINVDTTQTEQLLRLLDTVVIKLEGGTDDDLKILDESPVELQQQQINLPKHCEKIDITKDDDDDEKKDYDTGVKLVTEIIDDLEDWDKEDEEMNKDNNIVLNIEKNETPIEEINDVNDDRKENTDTKTKRKRSHSESSSSSSSSSDSDEDKTDDKPDEEDQANIKNDFKSQTESNIQDEAEDGDSIKNIPVNSIEEQPKDEDSIELETNGEEENKEKMDISENKPEEINNSIEKTNDDEKEDKVVEEKSETIDLDKEKDPKDDEIAPRALHKTSSIFLRNLAPTITKAEVEAICKKYDGFLRVAIADPLGERRWFRRGWVTFRRDVNKKEICWNLNNMRLRDYELGAIVNRDLSRRVRPVNGITAHKTVLRSDIKLCAKIAHNLDEKSGLWREDDSLTSGILDKITKHQNNESFGLNSKNPVLQNITDYLIEEASAEEDELLGVSESENKENTDGEIIERDPQLLTVLDKLILYLRIVHSVDFYNHCEYPYEDEMPNRCGIIHVRGPPPQKVTYQEIQDYIRNFETKMISFLSKNTTIDENELKKLGAKDCEAEVEKFVQSNTQELSKDKWLCPLSGKKFKGPEFIQKHIFNKHGEKVDEVRKEVEYFNNYLKDAKRPQLPEHPGTNKKPNEIMPAAFRPGYPGPPAYGGPPYGGYAPPAAIVPPRVRPGYGPRRGIGAEYRPIIHYRDLDAPREPDEFI